MSDLPPASGRSASWRRFESRVDPKNLLAAAQGVGDVTGKDGVALVHTLGYDNSGVRNTLVATT
ncbi:MULTISPECIES: hypothetical protein [unclassified Streptomyces]|uniref:hypothetical protein n=1 Tax=unclassified Streptomyces TaxID=2593676 RepID=UPI00074685EE|nr:MULTISPECIES: hypothetical protein [unclassified Streptomyces]KUL69396.1 hypothetical protein ADL33_30925 [Streptomyces sp. NRRL WC-3604]KUL70061.1 hypothetical protein ADL34_28575 [Streptomyces sp. NRRL WC-3605]